MCHSLQVFTCIILDIHSILLSLCFIIFFSCFEVSHMYEFFTRNIFFCDFSVVCLLFIYYFLVEWIVFFFFLFKIPSIKESSTSTTWRLSIFQKIQSMGILEKKSCHVTLDHEKTLELNFWTLWIMSLFGQKIAVLSSKYAGSKSIGRWIKQGILCISTILCTNSRQFLK